MSANLKNIPLSQIRVNPVALRGVDKEGEQYVHLRDSIGQKGVLTAISVRSKYDADGTPYFELCDGLQRFTASCDVGADTIPAQILELNDAEVLEAQIVANLCRVDTKPVEYTKQISRMFTMNPTLTKSELAERISQSPAWIDQRLNLLKLDAAIQVLVDDGKIGLANAYSLGKLPKEEQFNFVDTAMTMQPAEFLPTVKKRADELRAAAREGRAAEEATFEPVPHLRKLGEFKDEYDNATAGPYVTDKAGAETAAEGFALGVAWALQLDADSVDVQRSAYEARVEKREEEKKQRAAERAEKKAKEAAEAAAKAKEAAGIA
jgi:ParB/RepB/Spo0J family partition protein